MLSITVCIAKLSELTTKHIKKVKEEEGFVREMSDDQDQFSGGRSIIFCLPYKT